VLFNDNGPVAAMNFLFAFLLLYLYKNSTAGIQVPVTSITTAVDCTRDYFNNPID
jgi:hypothetical protein